VRLNVREFDFVYLFLGTRTCVRVRWSVRVHNIVFLVAHTRVRVRLSARVFDVVFLVAHRRVQKGLSVHVCVFAIAFPFVVSMFVTGAIARVRGACVYVCVCVCLSMHA